MCEERENDWYIYVVKNSQNLIEYIGLGRFREIINLSAIKTNKFYNSHEVYHVSILDEYRFKRRLDAVNKLPEIKQSLCRETPRMNLCFRSTNRDMRVVCISTGERFNRAVDVCKRYGISPAQISAHLSRRKGYNNVRGLKFAYEYELERAERAEKLTEYWTGYMYDTAPIDWELQASGLSKEVFDQCVMDYFGQVEFVHKLDKNTAKEGRFII